VFFCGCVKKGEREDVFSKKKGGGGGGGYFQTKRTGVLVGNSEK